MGFGVVVEEVWGARVWGLEETLRGELVNLQGIFGARHSGRLEGCWWGLWASLLICKSFWRG